MKAASAVVERETEVVEKAQRRRFSGEYKARILKEAERCLQPGELGALLRKEGLYSSHLASWRAARAEAERMALMAKKRGPKGRAAPHPLEERVAQLEKRLAEAEARAQRAEELVELQKEIAQLLGPPPAPRGEKP
jgi:transposase